LCTRSKLIIKRWCCARVSNEQAPVGFRKLERVDAIEAASWLHAANILKDSPERPGLPLRALLRLISRMAAGTSFASQRKGNDLYEFSGSFSWGWQLLQARRCHAGQDLSPMTRCVSVEERRPFLRCAGRPIGPGSVRRMRVRAAPVDVRNRRKSGHRSVGSGYPKADIRRPASHFEIPIHPVSRDLRYLGRGSLGSDQEVD
jgi:hypothetical protein